MRLTPNPESVALKYIELSGGKANVIKETDDAILEFNALWLKPMEQASQILKAHLVVEYYMNKALKSCNPNLGDLEKARLTFNQKVTLLKGKDAFINQVLEYIAHLNRIRNRFAHNIDYELTSSDRDVFLSFKYYSALREALAYPDAPSDEPIAAILEFAKYACTWIDSLTNEMSQRWARAIREAGEEQQNSKETS